MPFLENDVLAAVVDAVGVPGPEFVISFELFSLQPVYLQWSWERKTF